MQARFIYLMISTVGGALADFFSKQLFIRYPSLSVPGYLVASWLFEIIVLRIFVLGRRSHESLLMFSWQFVGILLVLVALRFLGNRLYYRAVKHIDLSVVTILFTFSTIISVSIGIAVYTETVSRMKFVGMFLTMFAIWLVYARVNRAQRDMRFLYFALGSGVVYGIVANMEKFVGLSFDPFVFRLRYSMLSVLLILFVYKPKVEQDIVYLKDRSFRWKNILIAICFSIMNLAMYRAFQHGAEAGKVDAINNSAVFFIIALEVLVLRDRHRLGRKLLAAVLSCLGVWLLY